MPSIDDQFKALGVHRGSGELKNHQPLQPSSKNSELDLAFGGQLYDTQVGQTYLVEQILPEDHRHGEFPIRIPGSRQRLADWAKEPIIADLPASGFVFLDTETTGISGGTGTYAFLVGIGRFTGAEFRLHQFFMRDPLEEPAQLDALERFIAPCQAIVTFNGKSFDIPLLNTRYLSHGLRSPFIDLAHVDLLHLARKLWRDRLPSRTLMSLEAQVLGTTRLEEDVPGWMIPEIYRRYLVTQDPSELKGVLYHNALDVLSMTALLHRMVSLLEDPLAEGSHHGVDLLSLARLFEDLGDLETATRLYLHGLDHEDAHQERIPNHILFNALERLGAIHKRGGDLDAAFEIWRSAAGRGYLPACIELSIACEHRTADLDQALYWTDYALEMLPTIAILPYERQQRSQELLHRRQRILQKITRRDTASQI